MMSLYLPTFIAAGVLGALRGLYLARKNNRR